MKKAYTPTILKKMFSLGLLSLFPVLFGLNDVQGKVLPSYDVTDLGFLPCDLGPLCDSSQAIAINEIGTIVGLVEVPDPHCNHAGLFQNGEWLDLGALGTTPGGTSQSQANDLNNRGQVVGSSNISEPPPPNCCIARHAFIWDEKEGMRDLGTLGTFTQCFDNNGEPFCVTSNFSDATAINDGGQVVGNTSTSTSFSRPFIWDQEGGMRDLSTSGLTEAVDINNRGQILGNNASGRGAILDQKGLHDIGSLDESFPFSTATAINNAGDVVGTSYLVEEGEIFFRAFLWRNGVMKALPLPPNDQFSQAFAVNDLGQVGGISITCDEFCTDHPVVWDGDDVIELPGFEEFGFKNLTGINNRGQAVGTRQQAEAPFISRGYLAEPH